MHKDQIKEGYDLVAKKHADLWLNDTSFNALIDRPAVLSLLPNIKDKKVLDLGCGPGKYSQALQQRGAEVTGLDISAEFINIAQQNFTGINFLVGDAENLPFEDECFDLVVSPLVLHYLENWDKALSQIKRVLKPEGVFIFSNTNPFMECRQLLEVDGKKWQVLAVSKDGDTLGDYFTEGWRDFKMFGPNIPFHHKTYQTIFRTLIRNGFTIEDFIDSYPTEELKEIDGPNYNRFSKFPLYFAMRLSKKS